MGDEITQFKQLEGKHAQIHDPLYGDCLVVPAKAFGNDWYEKLRGEGHKVFQGTIDRRAVFLVQVKVSTPAAPTAEPEAPGNERLVFNPRDEGVKRLQDPPAPTPSTSPTKHSFLGKPWTGDEDNEVIKGITLAQSNEEIAKQLPGRTPIAVGLRVNRLRKHGILPKSRGRGARRIPITTESKAPGKRGRPRKTLIRVQQSDEPKSPSPEPLSTPTQAPITPFPEMWEAAVNAGQDIQSLAEQVYNECVKAKIPTPIIEALLRMFAEILGHVNWLNDNKVDQEQLNKTNILFRQHKHVVNKIFVPLEAQ